jgi:hypothetical protein
LKFNTDEGDILLAAKDVGLESQRQFFEDAILYYSLDTIQLKEFLKNSNVKFIVVRKKYDYSRLVFGEKIDSITQPYFQINEDFGDFEIWKLKL